MENVNLAFLQDGIYRIDDWEATNDTGGVGVWDIPPTFAPVFNPVVFRKRMYYFAYGAYQPNHRVVFLQYSQQLDLEFVYQTDVDIYVKYRTTDDAVEVGLIAAGYTSLQGVEVAEVYGISLTEDGPFLPYIKTDTSYYIANSTRVVGEMPVVETYPLIDDGYLLTTSNGDVLYSTGGVESGSLTIENKRTGEEATITGSSYAGALRFDVAPILRAWLGSELLPTTESTPIVYSDALFVPYAVAEPYIYDMPDTFVGLNAVVQIGESADFSNKVGKVLTTKPILSYYEGYPLDYSVLAGEDGVLTPNGTVSPYSVGRVYVLEGLLLLLTEDGTPVLTEEGEYIYLYGGDGPLSGAPIQVVERCVPSAPFYVRWINTEGGVDYWMFERQQERTLGVSNVEIARMYVGDMAQATTNIRTVSIDTTNTIKVGAMGLKKGDFDALRKLPFAPVIEWWNEATQKWVGLSIESYDLNYGTMHPLHDVEITFAFPELYTQQAVWQ